MKTDITYRNLFKSTALLGGVQMITILLNMIRGKVVARLLGTAGMGVYSLYTMVANLVVQFSGLGFQVSGVREIAAEQDRDDEHGGENGNRAGEGDVCRASMSASLKVKAMRRINLLAAACGMTFVMASAKWLSILTFGDDSYSWGFVALGLHVFITTMVVCENAVLQGFRQLKSIAYCNVASALFGVFIGLPMYYFFGQSGIVPAMVVTALLYFVIIRRKSGKIQLRETGRISWKECWNESKLMLSLGLSMTVGYVLGSLANYFISGGVRYLGTINDVGLFSGAIAITSQYSAIVFSAIATDYLPQLSGVAKNKHKSFVLINKQTELVMLAVAPITVMVIFFSPIIIRLLLTTEFLSTVYLVRWLAITTFIQACYFPISYLPVAHGDKRLYFWLECIWTNIKTPLLMLAGYYFWGLWGLGYASVCNALIDLVSSIIIMRWRYDAVLSWKTTKVSLLLAVVVLFSFASSFIENLWVAYGLMGISAVVITAYSLKELDKRIELKKYLRQRFRI